VEEGCACELVQEGEQPLEERARHPQEEGEMEEGEKKHDALDGSRGGVLAKMAGDGAMR